MNHNVSSLKNKIGRTGQSSAIDIDNKRRLRRGGREEGRAEIGGRQWSTIRRRGGGGSVRAVYHQGLRRGRGGWGGGRGRGPYLGEV